MAEKTYRLLRGNHSVRSSGGERMVYEPGDIVALTPGELVAFGDKFEDAAGAKPQGGVSIKVPGSTGRVQSQDEIAAAREADQVASAASAEAEIRAIAGDPVPDFSADLISLVGTTAGPALIEEGFASFDALEAASDAEIKAVTGVGDAALKKIREA